jgi:hypothetical protein
MRISRLVAEVQVGRVDNVLDPLLRAENKGVVDGVERGQGGGKSSIHARNEGIKLSLGKGHLRISKGGKTTRVDLGLLECLESDESGTETDMQSSHS